MEYIRGILQCHQSSISLNKLQSHIHTCRKVIRVSTNFNSRIDSSNCDESTENSNDFYFKFNAGSPSGLVIKFPCDCEFKEFNQFNVIKSNESI